MKKVLFGALLGALLCACGGKIPENYQGLYADPTTGAKLELKSDEGSFRTPEGRLLSYKAEDLEHAEDLENLIKGIPGLYTRLRGSKMALFWLNPDSTTKEVSPDQNHITYAKSEGLYVRLDLERKDKIKKIEVTYFEDGRIAIDRLYGDGGDWRASWGPKPTRYDLLRVE